jgi:hypothetical protein
VNLSPGRSRSKASCTKTVIALVDFSSSENYISLQKLKELHGRPDDYSVQEAIVDAEGTKVNALGLITLPVEARGAFFTIRLGTVRFIVVDTNQFEIVVNSSTLNAACRESSDASGAGPVVRFLKYRLLYSVNNLPPCYQYTFMAKTAHRNRHLRFETQVLWFTIGYRRLWFPTSSFSTVLTTMTKPTSGQSRLLGNG